jgi:hypothetical protein
MERAKVQLLVLVEGGPLFRACLFPDTNSVGAHERREFGSCACRIFGELPRQRRFLERDERKRRDGGGRGREATSWNEFDLGEELLRILLEKTEQVETQRMLFDIQRIDYIAEEDREGEDKSRGEEEET